MRYDFYSFLFLDDEDFIEDRRLLEGGHPELSKVLAKLQAVASDAGLKKEEINSEENRYHAELSEVVACIEVRNQIVDELIGLFISEKTGYSTPFLRWLKEQYDCCIIPEIENYPGRWES